MSFLKCLSEEVEELGNQIVKWNSRLPDLNDENDEKVPTASEVQEELTTLTDDSYKKFHTLFNRLHTLENIVTTLDQKRGVMGSRQQSSEHIG